MPLSKGSGIKSIQRVAMTIGSGSTTGTAAITSVNTAKTELFLLGTSPSADVNTQDFARLWLNSAIEVGAVRSVSAGNVLSLTVQVTEYY